MPISAADQALFQIVSGPDATTVDEVLAKMRQIDAAFAHAPIVIGSAGRHNATDCIRRKFALITNAVKPAGRA